MLFPTGMAVQDSSRVFTSSGNIGRSLFPPKKYIILSISMIPSGLEEVPIHADLYECEVETTTRYKLMYHRTTKYQPNPFQKLVY